MSSKSSPSLILRGTIIVKNRDHSQVYATKIEKLLKQKNFVYSPSNGNKFIFQKKENVEITIPVSMMNLVNPICINAGYNTQFYSSKYSTIFVDMDKTSIEECINKRIFSFINVKRYPVGYQCFFKTYQLLVDFVKHFLDGEYSEIGIHNIFPFKLMQPIYGNNATQYPLTPLPEDDLRQFVGYQPSFDAKSIYTNVSKPNLEALIDIELQNAHIVGDLFDLLQELGRNLGDKILYSNNILETICNDLDDGAYETITLALQDASNDDEYLKICNELCDIYINDDESNESVQPKPISHPQELLLNESTIQNYKGNLKFSSEAKINIYDVEYQLYNTNFDDSNFPTYLKWFSEGSDDQFIGFNYFSIKKIRRVILTLNKKILLISFKQENKNSFLKEFSQFLGTSTILYYNNGALTFINENFKVNVRDHSYYYNDLCFTALGINYSENLYLKKRIKIFSDISNSLEPEIIHVFSIASKSIFYYESFLVAMRKHVHAKEIYNVYIKYRSLLESDRNDSPNSDEDDDDVDDDFYDDDDY